MAYGDALAALADPTRRAVFEKLRQRPRTVGELASELPVSQPAVSQHLRRLREAHLVEERREGTRRYYRVSAIGLNELRDYLDGFWGDVLSAFAAWLVAAAAAAQAPAPAFGEITEQRHRIYTEILAELQRSRY